MRYRNPMDSIHFPKEFLAEVVQKNDIIGLAQEYFDLTQVGSIYQTNCLHGDKDTKSLTFYPSTNSFYCFGCHAGAADVTGSSDVIAFISWVEDIPWKEAVIHLAKRAKIDLPEKVLTAEEQRLQALYFASHTQNIFYWETLNDRDHQTHQWFLDRGITQEDIDIWRLGSDGYRPVYTIIDDMGRACAFSYRRKPGTDDGPKYKNSKDSPIFKKGTILYGLHNIKSLIRRLGYVVLVEGFNDVIMLQKYGVPALGIMGTSLTDEQIKLILKYTNKAVLFLDGDAGGDSNAWRLIKKLNNSDILVRVMHTPGMDPDDLALIKKDQLRSYIESTAMLAGQYAVSRMITQYNETHVLLSKKLLSDLHTVLEPVTDPLERDLYITQVSMTVNVPKNIIYDTLKENPYEECSDESGT